MGDQTTVHHDHLVRAVLAQALVAAGEVDVLHPGAPEQTVLVSGGRLDHHVALQPGKPRQLLGHDAGLQLALLPGLNVLEVAAATPAGVREGHGACTR